MNWLNHDMVQLSLIRRRAERDGDEVAARIGFGENHFVQGQFAGEFVANAIAADQFDRQQCIAIELRKFFTKMLPFFAVYFWCVHKF